MYTTCKMFDYHSVYDIQRPSLPPFGSSSQRSQLNSLVLFLYNLWLHMHFCDTRFVHTAFWDIHQRLPILTKHKEGRGEKLSNESQITFYLQAQSSEGNHDDKRPNL